MEIKATQRNIRQTPSKLRLVARAVTNGKNARKTQTTGSLESVVRQLTVIERRAALPILKVVRQAIADAQHNFGIKIEDLGLKSILINVGPTFKRFNAVSRGRGHRILKRSAHVTVVLETQDKKEAEKTASKQAAVKLDKPKKKATPKKASIKKATTQAKSKEV